jgi:hypothetical protein
MCMHVCTWGVCMRGFACMWGVVHAHGVCMYSVYMCGIHVGVCVHVCAIFMCGVYLLCNHVW